LRRARNDASHHDLLQPAAGAVGPEGV